MLSSTRMGDPSHLRDGGRGSSPVCSPRVRAGFSYPPSPSEFETEAILGTILPRYTTLCVIPRSGYTTHALSRRAVHGGQSRLTPLEMWTTTTFIFRHVAAWNLKRRAFAPGPVIPHRTCRRCRSFSRQHGGLAQLTACHGHSHPCCRRPHRSRCPHRPAPTPRHPFLPRKP